MKNSRAVQKGLILSNFLYMAGFFVVYFPLTAIALYMKDTICGLAIFVTYCAQIPASSSLAMNFVLFVMIPMAAILFTIFASRQPAQQPVGY